MTSMRNQEELRALQKHRVSMLRAKSFDHETAIEQEI